MIVLGWILLTTGVGILLSAIIYTIADSALQHEKEIFRLLIVGGVLMFLSVPVLSFGYGTRNEKRFPNDSEVTIRYRSVKGKLNPIDTLIVSPVDYE